MFIRLFIQSLLMAALLFVAGPGYWLHQQADHAQAHAHATAQGGADADMPPAQGLHACDSQEGSGVPGIPGLPGVPGLPGEGHDPLDHPDCLPCHLLLHFHATDMPVAVALCFLHDAQPRKVRLADALWRDDVFISHLGARGPPAVVVEATPA